MTRAHRLLTPRSVPQFAFLPCLFWMGLALAGTQLLFAEDGSPLERAASRQRSYFVPRSESGDEGTGEKSALEGLPPGTLPILNRSDAQPNHFSSLWTSVPVSEKQKRRLSLVNDDLQTIRWDPSFDQPARPTIFGAVPPKAAGESSGLQRTSHEEMLPNPEPGGADLTAPADAPSSFPHQTFNFWATDNIWLQFDGLIRGYYHNDQRIEWSGVEASFGAEGILRPLIFVREGDFQISAEAELFLNQPYGRSLFSNPLSQPYRSNFDIDTFEIFQMFVQVRYQDFYFRIGKSRTPFGRYYAPMFTNSLQDAPFIRSEIIDWTETGLFLRYDPGFLCFDLAITNGESDLDTNSSKAILARLGFNVLDNFVIGFSGKLQDGISSEEQKRHHSYFGLDFLYSCGRFVFYGELLYDEHGFRRDFYTLAADKNNLGYRSLYGRDVFAGGDPISGTGYYVAAGYRGDRYLIDLSYGDYFPEEIGNAAHDEPIHRTVAKFEYWLTRNLQSFAVGLIENDRPFVTGLNRGQWAFFTGCQFSF